MPTDRSFPSTPQPTSATEAGPLMPAEWSPHSACLIAWPTRRSLWRDSFELAKREYAAVAAAISRFEKVIVVAAPGAGEEVERAVDAEIEIVEIPIDDSWLRDSGPIFVRDAGDLIGVDFRFNSWGERFVPYADDALVGERILARMDVPSLSSEMVLEGGSITVDGEGTLITTEQCLLNPNRNPGWSKERIEAELRGRLGARKIIWLPFGHAEDEHTDGHVDGVCAFVEPGVLIVQSCEDESHPDYERMRANRAVLESEVDAGGRSFEFVEVPLYPRFELEGDPTMVSYVNFYVANGGVVVPIADHPLDDEALTIIAGAFADREVVGVSARAIAHGGGGIHCITQQVPEGLGA